MDIISYFQISFPEGWRLKWRLQYIWNSVVIPLLSLLGCRIWRTIFMVKLEFFQLCYRNRLMIIVSSRFKNFIFGRWVEKKFQWFWITIVQKDTRNFWIIFDNIFAFHQDISRIPFSHSGQYILKFRTIQKFRGAYVLGKILLICCTLNPMRCFRSKFIIFFSILKGTMNQFVEIWQIEWTIFFYLYPKFKLTNSDFVLFIENRYLK